MFVDPYFGTVTIFGGNFAPLNWMFCQGQLLSINEYSALYALIGTTYGGDGQNTFALPDLRGRRGIHYGQGPGLPTYFIGETVGAEQTTLLSVNLPMHNHGNPVLTGTPQGSTDTTGLATPNSSTVPAAGAPIYGPPEGLAMGPYSSTGVTVSVGNNMPVPTIAPYLAMNYIINVEGIFPSRN
ncbi:phage tail protein [Flavobacterium sp.]|uniref:phage tail protein n=1 Tax=Flavobacterium sp. TaxID=239 RepID=UPI00261AD198|nr:tail fiber protein [Flavobacterium sp.]